MSEPDSSEPCHCCGAMPTYRSNGLCRHCNDGGDAWEEDDDDEPEHVCFEDTCVCLDGMCGDSEIKD